MAWLRPVLSFLSLLARGIGIGMAVVFIDRAGRAKAENTSLKRNAEVRDVQVQIAAAPNRPVPAILDRMRAGDE
jgi:hypothetical protein